MSVSTQLYKSKFTCNICNASFWSLRQLQVHFTKAHFVIEKNECLVCQQSVGNQTKHINKKHLLRQWECKVCESPFLSKELFDEHYKSTHPSPSSSRFQIRKTAFERRVETFSTDFENEEEVQTCSEAAILIKEPLQELILHQLQIKKMMKFAIIFIAKYIKYDELGNVGETITAYLRSNSKSVYLADQGMIKGRIEACANEIETRHDALLLNGSGWTLGKIFTVNIEFAQLSLTGGCKNENLKLSSSRAKYILDPVSKHNHCFLNSLACGFLDYNSIKNCSPKKLGIITTKYSKLRFNIKKLIFPLKVSDIHKFELKNKQLNCRINVFTMDENELLPVYKSISKSPTAKVINLFLYMQKKSRTTHHYVFIRDLNKFIGQIKTKFYCDRCLAFYTRESALLIHQKLCEKEDPVRIEYSEKGTQVEFENFQKRGLQGLFGSCDFEASLQPVTKKENAAKYNCQNCRDQKNEDNCTHAALDIHNQIPTTYSIAIVDVMGKIIFEKTESDFVNVMEKFFATVAYIESNIFPLLQKYKDKKDYTPQEQLEFFKADKCYLCNDSFSFGLRRKVRDHCHYSNKFLGAAHSDCNWKRKTLHFIPIFIHNFKNYDVQFLLQGLKHSKSQISGIPYNTEKFRTLKVGRVCFVDSLAMLPASLSELVFNLRASDHNFNLIKQIPLFTKNGQSSELLQKGVYPYEWASSVSKLINSRKFPKHKHFYSTLTQSNISEQEYQHGKRVFEKFNCRHMLDYCHLYCKLDTILLLEVMVAFREMVFNKFGLDCTKYISIPQLAFDAMLLQLEESIELMTDPDMILMCAQNIKGGVSFIGERWCKLKNFTKASTVAVDDKIQDQLLYIDANNLYSLAQSCPMPFGAYEWCTEDDINLLYQQIENISPNSKRGLILEVDIEYPDHLHEKHSSLPLLPTHINFTFDSLSSYSQQALNALKGEKAARQYKATKLTTDLKSKTKYVIHYRNLQLCLKQGLKLTKIHRAIKFIQQRYLKPFIDMCTQERVQTDSVFWKMLWKLFMNSVYGKFLQDNRKHMEVKIVRNFSSFSRFLNSPFYKTHRIISNDVTAVYMQKKRVKLDRLYATGFSILEMSKNHMFRSWYEFIQPQLGEKNVGIVLTDTDSFILHVKNMSRNDMLDALEPCMDFSNYPTDHPRFSNKCKAVPGYFKDENCGNYITEVVGLKSKCYCLKVLERNKKNEKVVCKGITKPARKTLSMSSFRNVVKNFKTIYTNIYTIRSKNHLLHTQKLRKIALSTADDKRFLLDCGIHTLPHGHFSMPKRCTHCNH